jgi:twitching motility protein PilT
MARFRVSVFKERGNFAMELRQIPSKLLTMEQIGLPASVRELLYKPRGLVLVTGPTGSGKSTTLASMIDIINIERDEAHIITVEDPIEYYHHHKQAVVTQREFTWTSRALQKRCAAHCVRIRISFWSVSFVT